MHARLSLRLCAFFVLFGLLFAGFSWVLRPNDDEKINTRRFYREPEDTLDMVYVGGSVCYCSWAPFIAWEEQGIASYSLSAPGVIANSIKYMVRDAIRLQNPALLVIDARPFEYTQDTYTSFCTRKLADSMPLFSANRREMIEETFPHFSDIQGGTLDHIAFYIDFLMYHNNWKSMLRDVATGRFTLYDPPLTRGFKLVYESNVGEIERAEQTAETLPVSETAENALWELLDELNESGVNALFIVAPCSESAEQRMRHNYVAKIVRARGFEFVNANDYLLEMDIDGEWDFRDYDHMCFIGAEKFTRYIAAYIADAYSLPDRRDDPTFTQWHADDAAWRAEVEANWTRLNAYRAEKGYGAQPREGG